MTTLTLILLSFVLTRLYIALASSLGFLDVPDQRKVHAGAIPLVGGMAIFTTVLIGWLVVGILPYSTGMMVICAVVFAVGVYDDHEHINPWLRLVIQYGAGAALAVWGGIAITNVGNLLAMGDIALLLLTVPLTALAAAGLSNAYNMIDGIDGLAASLIALPIATLYALASAAQHDGTAFLLLLLVPLAVFLVFNLGPNNKILPKVFLGDGGSVTLGFLVTASLVYFSQGTNAIIEPVTALWLVTVPLMDMLSTMARRLKHGQKLMEADRSHVHHSLLDMGLSPRQTLLVMVAYGGLCALVGLALEAIPAYFSLLIYFLLFLSHCLFVIWAAKKFDSASSSGKG